ncbi:hypothetical protein [uncultured Phascolarctobacterium sp.]|uniref:hypothetical protein n=1 Tax=uncultured Phascolarctobacterium sp. TaxID=512296 RepID=UPI0027D9841F|nr:hypothetical protein [uncultured Phascolarctobacterium sp.]
MMFKVNRFWCFIIFVYIVSFLLLWDSHVTDKNLFGQYLYPVVHGGRNGTLWVRTAFVGQYLIMYTLTSIILLFDRWIVSPEYYKNIMLRGNLQFQSSYFFGIPILNVPFMLLYLTGSRRIGMYELFFSLLILSLYIFGLYKLGQHFALI